MNRNNRDRCSKQVTINRPSVTGREDTLCLLTICLEFANNEALFEWARSFVNDSSDAEAGIFRENWVITVMAACSCLLASPEVRQPWWRHQMETCSSPLWGESTGHRWIPLTRASDALMFSLTCAWKNYWSKMETPVIWDAMINPSRWLWRHCNGHDID